MKAIETRYHGPTNTRGARISASDSDGNRVTISYPSELSGEAVHRVAAETLCAKMNWTAAGELVSWSTKRGYVFVFPDGTKAVKPCECGWHGHDDTGPEAWCPAQQGGMK